MTKQAIGLVGSGMIRKALGFLIAPVLGLGAMLLPVLIWPPARHYDAPFFPLLRDAVESVGLPQLLLLCAAGLILGLVSTSRAWRLSAAAVMPLPLVALAELIQDPTSPNLLPIEFIFYALYGV